MKRRYKEHAKKRPPGGYVPAPHVVIRSSEYAGLSPRATKLLWDLLAQYKGDNNGDFCAAMTVMRERGWRSKAGLHAALHELIVTEFVVVTRKGGRHRAALYGVTIFAIDYCNGKLDITAPTRRFMGTWKRGEIATPPTGQSVTGYPTGGAKSAQRATNCPAGRSSQPDFCESTTPRAGTFLEIPLGEAAGQGAKAQASELTWHSLETNPPPSNLTESLVPNLPLEARPQDLEADPTVRRDPVSLAVAAPASSVGKQATPAEPEGAQAQGGGNGKAYVKNPDYRVVRRVLNAGGMTHAQIRAFFANNFDGLSLERIQRVLQDCVEAAPADVQGWLRQRFEREKP